MLVDFGGIGDALLHLGLRGPGLGLGQHIEHGLRAQSGQAVVQAGGGVVWLDVDGAAQEHGAGVQPHVHLHDAHAGLRVARFNGAVDGGGTAPAWQQRGVDVQAAQGRRGQGPGGQDQPIGGDDHGIGLGLGHGLLRGTGVVGVFAVQAQAARLGQGQLMGQGKLFDR